MPIAAPDFESCDPKCRCLSGELAGTVYNCANPCSGELEEFDADACTCEVDYGIDCCKRYYFTDFTRRLPSNGNCAGSPWENFEVEEIDYTDVRADLPFTGKFLRWEAFSNTFPSCAGYDGQCDDTIGETFGVTYFLGFGRQTSATGTLSDAGLCGIQGVGLLYFEACEEWAGRVFPGDLVINAIGSTRAGGVTEFPNSFILNGIRPICTEPKQFNEDTCQCECPNQCPEGYTLDSSTCECEPDSDVGGAWRFNGTYTRTGEGFTPVTTPYFSLGPGDALAIGFPDPQAADGWSYSPEAYPPSVWNTDATASGGGTPGVNSQLISIFKYDSSLGTWQQVFQIVNATQGVHSQASVSGTWEKQP